MAAGALCNWVRAIYDYASAKPKSQVEEKKQETVIKNSMATQEIEERIIDMPQNEEVELDAELAIIEEKIRLHLEEAIPALKEA